MHLDIPLDIFTYPHIGMPSVFSVEQRFKTPALTEHEIELQVTAAVKQFAATDARLKPGATVAIGSGSRGLDNLVCVVRAAVAALKAEGIQPFLIPAMGSHGGATAEGQSSLLIDYGLTQTAVGADILATMDVVELGRLSGPEAGSFEGHSVCYDRIAHGADAVLIINRIKPHTDFTGDIESGIGKMAAIGLGKRKGAEGIHHYGAHGLRELMPRVARYLARFANIVGGIALIENELGHTAEIHSVAPRDIAAEGEMRLLKRARELSPRIPFGELDLLVIDEMGKNISGAGMDTHVIGRGFMPSIPEESWGGPNIRLIAVLDLTAPSHGNATALGLADMMTRQLLEKVDFEAMLINMRTSGEGGIMRARLPLIMPTAEDCVRTGYGACGRGNLNEVRFARIRNTADTQFLQISEALVSEARADPSLIVSDSSATLDLSLPVKPGV